MSFEDELLTVTQSTEVEPAPQVEVLDPAEVAEASYEVAAGMADIENLIASYEAIEAKVQHLEVVASKEDEALLVASFEAMSVATGMPIAERSEEAVKDYIAKAKAAILAFLKKIVDMFKQAFAKIRLMFAASDEKVTAYAKQIKEAKGFREPTEEELKELADTYAKVKAYSLIKKFSERVTTEVAEDKLVIGSITVASFENVSPEVEKLIKDGTIEVEDMPEEERETLIALDPSSTLSNVKVIRLVKEGDAYEYDKMITGKFSDKFLKQAQDEVKGGDYQKIVKSLTELLGKKALDVKFSDAHLKAIDMTRKNVEKVLGNADLSEEEVAKAKKLATLSSKSNYAATALIVKYLNGRLAFLKKIVALIEEPKEDDQKPEDK